MAAAALVALPLAEKGVQVSREVIKGLFSALGEPVLSVEDVRVKKNRTTRTKASIPAWLPVGAALTWILWKWLGSPGGGGGGGVGINPFQAWGLLTNPLGPLGPLTPNQQRQAYESLRQNPILSFPGTPQFPAAPPVAQAVPYSAPIVQRPIPPSVYAMGAAAAAMPPGPAKTAATRRAGYEFHGYSR